MKKLTGKQILALPMEKNDSGATTIKGYLQALLETLLKKGEGFSGKRPFGNSGWIHDFEKTLIVANVITGKLDKDGWVETADDNARDKALLKAIRAL